MTHHSPLELKAFKERYLPSEAGFSRVISRIGDDNINVARTALAYFLNPGIQWHNNPEFIQAVMMVAAYRTLGDPLGSRDRVDAAVRDVDRIRSGEKENQQQFDRMISAMSTEWQQRIDGYETKAALSAPRQYWSDRDRTHKCQAAQAKKRWAKWTLATITVSVIIGLVLFTGVGEWLNQKIDAVLNLQPTDHGQSQRLIILTSFLKKAIIFGTLLGVAVWWLRQLLRELRSHEHLAEDAAERVTMIETYAAFKGSRPRYQRPFSVLNALYLGLPLLA